MQDEELDEDSVGQEEKQVILLKIILNQIRSNKN
jgi:hypothetical protein